MAVTINIPSQVKTYANLAAFPATGSLKTIFIAEDTNKTYRWTGSVYVEISGADFSGYVPTSRTLTINGTTQDLSANRTFTIPTDLTVGTTPIASGTIGRVLFQGTGNVLQQSGNLAWNNTNNQFSLLTNSDLASSALSGLSVKNSNSTGYANTLWYNNNDDVGQFMMTGTSGAISGTNIIARQANFINAGGTGGINLLATAGHITFLAGSGSTSKMTFFQTGNLAINTTTDAGFRLDVNGTARVQGNTTVALNQNAITSLTVQNNTVGTSAQANITVTANSNSAQFTKLSTGLTPYKTLAAGDLGIYNTTSDISLLTEGSGKIKFAAGGVSTAQMTLFATGNLGINTTTDAGFKLDVNGTARVNNDLTIGSNRYLKAFRWTQDDVTKSLQLESNSNYNVDSVNVISLNNSLLNNTKNLINIGLSSTVSTQSSSSTDFFNSVLIQTAYNFTNGTHTVKGIYYNPTLTSMVGTTHHAFHSTSGRIRFENLPTSPVGLSSGDIWNNLGILTIV
jgi:hypothetical protein